MNMMIVTDALILNTVQLKTDNCKLNNCQLNKPRSFMKVTHYEQIEAAPVDTDGAVNCRMRCLIGPDDSAPSFSMRQFE